MTAELRVLSPTAILNIGGRSTSIIIVSKGYERLSHNYEIGGYEMTKAVANSLGISPDQAEALKRRYGLLDSPENKARPAMLSLVDMMIFETRKTVEAYEQAHGQKISRVVLIGGLWLWFGYFAVHDAFIAWPVFRRKHAVPGTSS